MAFLEIADEFPRTMAIFDAGVNLAGEQVDPGEQAQRGRPEIGGMTTRALRSAGYIAG
jgi:hypothetical protein